MIEERVRELYSSHLVRIINAMLDARKEANMTQKQLAAKTGIAQRDISKIERSIGNMIYFGGNKNDKRDLLW